MKSTICIILVALIFSACQSKTDNSLPITGTWKLLTGTLVQNDSTTVTDYTTGKEFIKILNGTHFSFLGHDLTKGKDSSTALFTCGGGTYTLKDSTYTEHLQYCNARKWEDNKFEFTVTIHNDTLIQRGVEKIPGTDINQYNTEKYIRLSK